MSKKKEWRTPSSAKILGRAQEQSTTFLEHRFKQRPILHRLSGQEKASAGANKRVLNSNVCCHFNFATRDSARDLNAVANGLMYRSNPFYCGYS